jgi:hypothetical protein
VEESGRRAEKTIQLFFMCTRTERIKRAYVYPRKAAVRRWECERARARNNNRRRQQQRTRWVLDCCGVTPPPANNRERAHKFSWFSMATPSRDPQMPQTDVCVFVMWECMRESSPVGYKSNTRSQSNSCWTIALPVSQPFYFEFEISSNLMTILLLPAIKCSSNFVS